MLLKEKGQTGQVCQCNLSEVKWTLILSSHPFLVHIKRVKLTVKNLQKTCVRKLQSLKLRLNMHRNCKMFVGSVPLHRKSWLWDDLKWKQTIFYFSVTVWQKHWGVFNKKDSFLCCKLLKVIQSFILYRKLSKLHQILKLH